MADETGQQIGIMNRDEALKLAKEKGLDLIEFAPMAKPPVARIMDYGKYIYREEKRRAQAKSKAKKRQLENN